MGYIINIDNAGLIIQALRQEYQIFAPRRLTGRGWKAGTDLIRYGEIKSASEIVTDIQSDYSPKDVFFPAVQTTQFFTADDIQESPVADRKILLFARACDINGIHRLDTIFLENGGQTDHYYQRQRAQVRLVLMECREGWDNCFCVAMGASQTADYSMAVRFTPEGWLVDVQDDDLAPYFSREQQAAFKPDFVRINKKQVRIPDIDQSNLKKVYSLPLWASYNDRCVSCGSCNTVCVSCSCFDTKDIIYHETSRDGERRRTWSSCMLEDFSTMAGGHSVRKTAAERMRFKTLHKVYDFKARFGENQMCVGCGRCDMRCPKEISFAETICQLDDALHAPEVNPR